MKQPELGRKIVELRKAKGYTQEELVEKCNLNVRTLQRIETGVVTPRTYTIKIIFAALDYNVFESPENTLIKFIRTNNSIVVTLRKLYYWILDIFNLRKHTMHKVYALIILALSILLVLSKFSSSNSKENVTRVRKHIEISNTNLTQWYSANQFDSIKSQYLDSANFIFDNAFQYLTPKYELPRTTNRKGVISWYELFKMNRIKIIEKKSKKMVIGNEIAVDLGVLIFNSDDSDGERIGTYFCQWHNVNNRWKIENEIFNLK